MWLLLGLGLFVAYCFVLYRRRCEHFRYFEKLGIPGPKPSLIFGNSLDIHHDTYLKCQQRWHKQYGPVFGYFMGQMPMLAIADAEILKVIHVKDFLDFTDRPAFISGRNAKIHDTALTALTGQRWKKVRSILTPSFTSSKLKMMNSGIASIVDGFIENVRKFEDKEMEIYPYYQALTMDTICKSALGVDYAIQKGDPNHPIIQNAKVLFEHKSTLFGLLLTSFDIFRPLLLLMFKLKRRRKDNSGHIVDAVFALREECKRIVESRRQLNDKDSRIDLLQLMIDAQGGEMDLNELTVSEDNSKEAKCPVMGNPNGGKLTNEEVVDNAFQVLLAGYETTSSSLAFITRLLLRFPDVQEKLREELQEATKDGTVFDFETLQKCQYMEAVIQECLRMYPPIYGFTIREASADKFYEEYNLRVKKSLSVAASTHVLHYREDYFPNPDEFQPSRFLPENRASLVPGAWQPFGSGPRNCIGMRFAQMEIKLTLAKLLTKYRLSSKHEPQGDPKIETDATSFALQRIKVPIFCSFEKL